uniref:Secreted protein n=1 Tax=Periophthalmus magnuspinnatus TaxID=409849 RepID=A0A3B4AHK6_9GOBI
MCLGVGLWWSVGPVLCISVTPLPRLPPLECVRCNPRVRVNEKGADHREGRQASPRHLCSPLAHRDPQYVTGPPLNATLCPSQGPLSVVWSVGQRGLL